MPVYPGALRVFLRLLRALYEKAVSVKRKMRGFFAGIEPALSGLSRKPHP
jgi:hypothetical protein